MLERERPLDDWDVFVLRHRKTPNLIFHVLSFFLFWLSLPLAFLLKNPYLAVGFFLSGLIGTAGHYLFADGTVDKREATSSAQVVYFSSLMVLLFISGRYTRIIQAAEVRFARYLAGELDSLVAQPEIEQKLGRPGRIA